MIGAFGLLVLGIALVVAEVFLVSFGALAVLAGICILLADSIAFSESQAWGWTFVIAEILLIPYVLWAAFRTLPKTRFGRRILLSGPATPTGPAVPSYDRLVGARGRALTDLRPAGTAEFGDDERQSVVSVGGLIERDAEVVVTAVEGAEIRVRRAPPVASAPPSPSPFPSAPPPPASPSP